MIKNIAACLVLFGVASTGVCQSSDMHGWTPLRPSAGAPVTPPEHGVAALTDDPAYPQYRKIYELIQISYNSPQGLNQAKSAIDTLEKSYPASPYPLFARAEYNYALMILNPSPKGSADVDAVLDKAMKGKGAGLPNGYILQAKIAAQMGDGERALNFAKTAIRFAPDLPEAQFALARAYDVSTNYTAAEEAYRKFLTLESNAGRQANIYSWMAEMFVRAGALPSQHAVYISKAKEAYRKSLELGPSDSRRWNYGKFLLIQVGDPVEAQPYVDQISKAYPGDSNISFMVGMQEYLKWAKANPKGGSLAALNAIQNKTGLDKEEAFAISAGFYGLSPIASAMLHANAIKNINFMSEDNPLGMPQSSTALFNAVYGDQLPMVKELIAHGADINMTSNAQMTPLTLSMYDGDVSLVKYLLEKGARVNVVNARGDTPLVLAAANKANAAALVRLLLKYKADATSVNAQGQTGAVIAATRGDVDALDVFLTDARISVDAKDKYGTLLAHACNEPAAVRYLLDKGANPWVSLGGIDIVDVVNNSYSDGPAAQKRKEESLALLTEARKKKPKQ